MLADTAGRHVRPALEGRRDMKRSSFLVSLAAFGVFAATGMSLASAKTPPTVTLPDGLKYVDLREGKGPMPQKGQTVTVHYVGTLLDGTKFDSSRDRGEPFEFPLGEGQVIAGWDEGVKTMRVGGLRRLIIPAKLGYGDQGAGDKIPPGATLVFEIELLGIK
jgi:peptidylprolyl isomerase